MKLGATIQDIRKKRNLSQGELANQLSITQTYLSQIESNKKTPSMDLLEKIGKVLGIPPYYFMFKGLEIDDIPEEKRDDYKRISPTISSMIEGFFIS